MADAAVEDRAKGADASDPRETSAKRLQILDGARRVFLADGFDGASMNEIARVAGVSKGTLYVYFPSKEALFEALIREERRRQGEQVCTLDSFETDVADALTRLGANLIAALTSPESIAQVRTVVGVTAKFPQIGRAFHESGPVHGRARLAAYLRKAAAAGALSIDDADVAAGQFMDLAIAEPVRAMLFAAQDRLDPEATVRHVASAVRLFMRAYAPRLA